MVSPLQKLDKLKKVFKSGDVIIKEGDPGGDFYILVKGKADVTLNGKRLATIDGNSGELFFGEMASILQEPRGATVTATEQCLVLAIPPDALPKVLQLSPSLLLKLLKQLAHRIQQLNKQETALDQDKQSVKHDADQKLIVAMTYMKSIIGLVEMLAAKGNNPGAKGMAAYLLETNPFNLKSGNSSGLNMELIEKHGLMDYFK